jgi:hypothetical protein
MDQDRSLKDLIRFLDPSGSLSDSDIAGIAQKMKFTDVLDIVTLVGKGSESEARELMAKYDDRFTVAKEYTSVPTAKKPSGFKPIKPVGSAPTIAQRPQNPNGNSQQDQDGADMDDVLADPMNKNKPEVRQIQSLLQRMQNR